MNESQQFPFLEMKDKTGRSLLRPLMPITLRADNDTITTTALLDTGADVNVMPYSIGIALGGIWDELPVVFGLSGNLSQQPARGLVVNAKVGRFEPVRLAFAWSHSDEARLLLGQMNFFRNYSGTLFSLVFQNTSVNFGTNWDGFSLRWLR